MSKPEIETTEPLAAILAEMRDYADHRAADAGGERPAIELLRSYAARIEAAAEQEAIDAELKWTRIGYDERKAEEKRAPCNAGAMREALEEQLRYWDSHVRDRSEEEMRKRTEAALAAPARNCDRFATEREAWKAYNALPRLYRSPAPYVEWLFEPAEGGAK